MRKNVSNSSLDDLKQKGSLECTYCLVAPGNTEILASTGNFRRVALGKGFRKHLI